MRKRLWGHDDETNRVVRRVVIQSDEGCGYGERPVPGQVRMGMPIAGDKRAADLPRRFFVGVKAGRRDGDQGPEALGHGTPLWQPVRQPRAGSLSSY